MARATTEIFAEATLEIETTGAALNPASQAITSITVAGVATVATGTVFTAGSTAIISGLPSSGGNADVSGKNGAYLVASSTATTVTLTGLDLSAYGAGPITSAQAPSMTLLPQPAGTLVWAKVCGLTSRTFNRTTTMQQTEIPDCSDETLPNAIEKAVQSQEQTIAGTGVWASESHALMLNWWRSGARKSVRIGNIKAPAGTPKYEYGLAYLTQVNNAAVKGSKVTSDVQIEFDGLPNLILA
jgi:tail tube protein